MVSIVLIFNSRFRFFLALFCSVVIFLSNIQLGFAAPYSVTPLKMELTTSEKGVATGSVEITNKTNLPLRIRVEMKTWALGDPLQQNTYEAQLLENLKIQPQELELEPQETQPIRFAIRLGPDFPKAEYHLRMYYKEVQTDKLNSGSGKKGASVKSFSRIDIGYVTTIYVYHGGFNALLENVSVKDFMCNYNSKDHVIEPSFALENAGTRHARLKPSFVLSGADKASYATARYLNDGTLVILPQTAQKFSYKPLKWNTSLADLTPGNYTLEVLLKDERNLVAPISSQCTLQVPSVTAIK